jgi:hypothetical protein
VLRVVPIEYSAPVICESCQELAGSYAFCPHCGERARATEIATPELRGVEQGVVN